MRFTSEWEREASLGLRRGETQALEDYDRHGRITGDEPDLALDRARSAFLGSYLCGLDVLMVAHAHEICQELSRREADREGGLLGKLTKMVVEGALERELDGHLGYSKNDPAGRDGGNSRNGHRAKAVLTDTGPVENGVPRDRDSSFEPKIIAKRQRRLTGVDDMVVSLSARADARGDRSPSGRGLRRRGVQADDHHDHRPGDGRHGRMAVPAAGSVGRSLYTVGP